MADVLPFLENVLRGRNVPRERMLQVAHHYEMFGGVSPINQQNRTLISALENELAINGPQLPIYWGNRNWHPLLPDTVEKMTQDGVRRALAFVTSAYSSFSSCRQYLQNIEDARNSVGPAAPVIEKLRAFYNHPLFVTANVEQIKLALDGFQEKERSDIRLVFTAHSIPESMASNCDYVSQLHETGSLVADMLGMENWRLVYQSRSGSPQQPWLGPDVCEYLKELATTAASNVLVAPIGFVSDHMEVIFDLDVEAQKLSQQLGLKVVRAATAGTHPKFAQMIRELILERTDNLTPRYLGTQGPRPDNCAADCCLAQRGV